MDSSKQNTLADVEAIADPALVRCSLTGISGLIAMLTGVTEVRVERPGKRVTAGMLAAADALCHLAARRHDGDDSLIERLQRAVADELDRIWLTARAHALAGQSADGTFLVLLFADRTEAREVQLQQ
jgi:hypothetical protein